MDRTLIYVAAGVAAYYLYTRRSAPAAAPQPYVQGYGPAPAAAPSLVQLASMNLAGAGSRQIGSSPQAALQQLAAPPPGTGPGAATLGGGPTGKDYVQAGAAIAAAAGCSAVGGVGAAAAPLCATAGSYLGGKGYDYGKQAYNEIKSWF
jgi:hypothetical protein